MDVTATATSTMAVTTPVTPGAGSRTQGSQWPGDHPSAQLLGMYTSAPRSRIT
jgi:hypothetical protein